MGRQNSISPGMELHSRQSSQVYVFNLREPHAHIYLYTTVNSAERPPRASPQEPDGLSGIQRRK